MSGAMDQVTLVRHGCVRFAHEGAVVYVDPFRLKGKPGDADVIVVTHAHGDHYSPRDIGKIKSDGTLYFVGGDVARTLREAFKLSETAVTPVQAGGCFGLGDGMALQAVPAENKNHAPQDGFGAVLTLGDFVYYLSGDTDVLDADVACDVLFCVCDGRYNMPDYLNRVPAEIARMKTPPRLVVPYHYDNDEVAGNGRRLAEKLNAMGIPAAVFGKV